MSELCVFWQLVLPEVHVYRTCSGNQVVPGLCTHPDLVRGGNIYKNQLHYSSMTPPPAAFQKIYSADVSSEDAEFPSHNILNKHGQKNKRIQFYASPSINILMSITSYSSAHSVTASHSSSTL